jgi:hypothetical protein
MRRDHPLASVDTGRHEEQRMDDGSETQATRDYPSGSGPESTIKRAITAYRTGNEADLTSLLHEDARLVGSEHFDNWRGPENARRGLSSELARHKDRFDSRVAGGESRPEAHISGSLLDLDDLEVTQAGEVAWAVLRGSLEIDGRHYPDTTWSVVLRGDGDDWKIAHSHFSIHR